MDLIFVVSILKKSDLDWTHNFNGWDYCTRYDIVANRFDFVLEENAEQWVLQTVSHLCEQGSDLRLDTFRKNSSTIQFYFGVSKFLLWLDTKL